MEEVTGGWRELHNIVFHDLYCCTNIITVMNSRRMWWAEHVARVGEKWNVKGRFMTNTKRRRPRGKPGRGWEIVKNRVGWRGMDSCGSRCGQVRCFCVHGNERSVAIKCRKFSWLVEAVLTSQEGLCSVEVIR